MQIKTELCSDGAVMIQWANRAGLCQAVGFVHFKALRTEEGLVFVGIIRLTRYN